MKKRTVIIFAALFCAVVLAILIVPYTLEQRPFRHLSAGEVTGVTVEVIPPGDLFALSDTQIRELVSILRSVTIYEEDDSYNSATGHTAVIFTITTADGDQSKVMPFHPFVVIDGTGYVAKTKPSQKLEAFASGLAAANDG